MFSLGVVPTLGVLGGSKLSRLGSSLASILVHPGLLWVTIKNYFHLLNGKVTPVQMEGMRLLLTPQPQQQFNATDDRKVAESGSVDSPGSTYSGVFRDSGLTDMR